MRMWSRINGSFATVRIPLAVLLSALWRWKDTQNISFLSHASYRIFLSVFFRCHNEVLCWWYGNQTLQRTCSPLVCMLCVMLTIFGSKLYIIIVTAKASEQFAHTISVVNHATIFTLCIEAKAETLSSGGCHANYKNLFGWLWLMFQIKRMDEVL